MKGNSIKMTDIPHQKAFEMYALEASRVTDTSFVLAVFVCSIICFIKGKPVTDRVWEPSDDPARHPKIWNYRAKRLNTMFRTSCRTLLHLVTVLLGHGLLRLVRFDTPVTVLT
jgi:hypothetical protein